MLFASYLKITSGAMFLDPANHFLKTYMDIFSVRVLFCGGWYLNEDVLLSCIQR